MAEAITWTAPVISDELYARLRAHFSEAQLVELAAMAAWENFRARFNRVFALESNHLHEPQPSAVTGE